MRKIATFLLIGISLLSSCKGNNQNEGSKEAETATVQEVEIQELNDETFAKLVGSPSSDGKTWNFASDKFIMVDFYATWCGPCKKMAPNVQEIANKYADKVTVYRVDVENARKTAAMFGIESIPTIVFVNPDKKNLTGQAGYQTSEDLEEMLKEKFGFGDTK